MPIIAQTQNVPQPFFPMADQAAPAKPAPASTTPETVTVTAPRDDTDDTGKTFFDNLLDVVNPLEHFPIISTIYSNLTGDKPNDFTQVAGDTLYGGPMGLISSIGNIAFTHIIGKSIGDTVWDWVTNKSDGSAAAKPTHRDDIRKPQAPSSDLFSFLRSNVGSDNDTTQVAAATVGPATSSASAATVKTAAIALVAAASVPQTPAAAATTASATSTPARIFNPLPARGAVPMHTAPSENVRAAGMASMIANHAHLKTPASEANTLAVQPAAPAQATAQPNQVAQQSPAPVSVGADGIPSLDSSGEHALLAALNKNGISGAIGQQALMAYQKTMAMSPDANNAAALQSAVTLH